MELEGPVVPAPQRLVIGRWHGIVLRRSRSLALVKRRIRTSRRVPCNGRPTYSWITILTEFLTPIPGEGGTSVSFPSLDSLAAKYGCAPGYLRAKAGVEGWKIRQREAEAVWWEDKSKELQRNMQNRLVALRAFAFTNATKAMERSKAALNGNPDSLTLLRAVSTTDGALQIVEKAVAGPRNAGAGQQPPSLGAAIEVPGPAGTTRVALWSNAQNLLRGGAVAPELVDLSPPALAPAKE